MLICNLALLAMEPMGAAAIAVAAGSVMAIQSGDNPRNVEAKLVTFLPPAVRVAEDERKAAA